MKKKRTERQWKNKNKIKKGCEKKKKKKEKRNLNFKVKVYPLLRPNTVLVLSLSLWVECLIPTPNVMVIVQEHHHHHHHIHLYSSYFRFLQCCTWWRGVVKYCVQQELWRHNEANLGSAPTALTEPFVARGGSVRLECTRHIRAKVTKENLK